MATYPGGKAGAGVYQRLINEIPPHSVYVAGFAGLDAIARFKRPAKRTVLIDLDPEPLEWWASAGAVAFGDSAAELHLCDAMTWLRVTFGLTCLQEPPTDRQAEYSEWFIYLDPPYLMETRSSGPMYRHEMTREQHVELLEVARRLPCNVMISGYWSGMYASMLPDWRVVKYWAVARNGERRQEYAWCNYPEPSVLHDSRFVGNDKREREKVRRRIRRLSSNLAALAPHERQAVLDAVAGIPSTNLATGDGDRSGTCLAQSRAAGRVTQ